jgi:ferric-dicitrate binding protein FerR (iron transport regulator)
MSEYWWDRSGEEDPELRELERELAPFGFQRTRGRREAPRPPAAERPTPRVRWVPWAALAAGLFVLLALWASWWGWKARPPAWEVLALHGAPRVEQARVGGRETWRVNQTLETGPGDRAKVLAGGLGQIDVEPRTRLRLLRAGPGPRRLALERGLIRLFIYAPARQFFVEMPGAVAVDLGCAYTLQSEEDGSGLLRVSFGWVAFESREHEVFVPAGAACALYPGTGPGTPYFEDASPAFRAALERLDRRGAEERPAALGALLAEARARDQLTLLHLLRLLPRADAERVYERAAALEPPPPGITFEKALQPQGYDLWWRQMGLGEMKWWDIGRLP